MIISCDRSSCFKSCVARYVRNVLNLAENFRTITEKKNPERSFLDFILLYKMSLLIERTKIMLL